MKAQPLASPLNNRIRSFLSPYSKFGTRSLSTTESRPTLDTSIVQHQKSYIDFRRVNRDGDMKPSIRIKLEDFTKKDCRKDQKLYKCTINKNKQNGKRWSKYEENGDLVAMVRELKQKVLDLQIENNMQTLLYRSLKQKQEQDAAKLLKQNDIIRNLQEAIILKRMRASHSLTICQRQSKNYDIARHCVQQSDKNQNKNRVKDKWYLERQNLKFYESQIENSEKEEKIGRQKDENLSKLKLKDLQSALLEIQISKRKELNEIDQLLFGWGL